MRVPKARHSNCALITNVRDQEAFSVRFLMNAYDADRSTLLGIELIVAGTMLAGRRYRNLYVLPLAPFKDDEEARHTHEWLVMMVPTLKPGGQLHWINPIDQEWFEETCRENISANESNKEVQSPSGSDAS